MITLKQNHAGRWALRMNSEDLRVLAQLVEPPNGRAWVMQDQPNIKIAQRFHDLISNHVNPVNPVKKKS